MRSRSACGRLSIMCSSIVRSPVTARALSFRRCRAARPAMAGDPSGAAVSAVPQEPPGLGGGLFVLGEPPRPGLPGGSGAGPPSGLHRRHTAAPRRPAIKKAWPETRATSSHRGARDGNPPAAAPRRLPSRRVLRRSARALRNLHDEQAYAWERYLRPAGVLRPARRLPPPPGGSHVTAGSLHPAPARRQPRPSGLPYPRRSRAWPAITRPPDMSRQAAGPVTALSERIMCPLLPSSGQTAAVSPGTDEFIDQLVDLAEILGHRPAAEPAPGPAARRGG